MLSVVKRRCTVGLLPIFFSLLVVRSGSLTEQLSVRVLLVTFPCYSSMCVELRVVNPELNRSIVGEHCLCEVKISLSFNSGRVGICSFGCV